MSLSSLLIGYRPVIDRDRRIMALQVRFASLGEEPTRLSELLIRLKELHIFLLFLLLWWLFIHLKTS